MLNDGIADGENTVVVGSASADSTTKLALDATLTDRTQKTQITNGTDDVAVSSSDPSVSTVGLVTRTIPFERQTFGVHADNITIGNGKSMVAIFNGAGSGVVLRITKLYIYNVKTTAVTGVIADFGLRKITARSVGTLLTTTGSASGVVFAYDSNNSLNANVSIATGSTVTESPAFDLKNWLWSSDEWGPGTSDVESMDHAFGQQIAAYEASPNAQALTMRPGEGFSIRQNVNSTAGTFDFYIEFTQAST